MSKRIGMLAGAGISHLVANAINRTKGDLEQSVQKMENRKQQQTSEEFVSRQARRKQERENAKKYGQRVKKNGQVNTTTDNSKK